MDEVKIEIKDELIHQDEELQTKKKFIASSSKENDNMFCNRCVLQFEKKYVFDLHLKLVHGENPFNEPEELEESGIFVKYETDVKPEIIFSLPEPDSHHSTTVRNDPLKISGHEEKYGNNIQCPATFDKEFELTKHFTKEHDVNNKDKNSAMTHEKTFQVDKEDILEKSIGKPIKCDTCNSFFKFKSYLKLHVETVHEGKKPFKCNVCDASFSQKAHLNGHIASLHENKSP